MCRFLNFTVRLARQMTGGIMFTLYDTEGHSFLDGKTALLLRLTLRQNCVTLK